MRRRPQEMTVWAEKLPDRLAARMAELTEANP